MSQSCAIASCADLAAYRTRSKPAYCTGHIRAIFRQSGVELVEPFAKPTEAVLTRCLTCGVEAHYRFVYVEDKNATGEQVCRACFWRDWAERARTISGIAPQVVPVDEARAYAEKNGYEYIRPLTDPPLSDDPHLTRCQNCGKIEAQRLGDMSFVCPCMKSSSRAAPTKTLLKDSGSTTLGWWDHEKNTAALWATVTPKARREAQWKCPDCEHSFMEQVYRMERPSCPKCTALARATQAEWRASLEGLTAAEIPELAEAWDDDMYESHEVPVTEGHMLRASGFRLRCPEGHHPRLHPMTYLQRGCPSCQGKRTRETNAGRVRLAVEVSSQYHPTRNTKPIEKVTEGSNQPVWWVDPVCGHEWAASPASREMQPRWRCPQCRTRRDSLGWHYPELATEWSLTNPVTAFHVLPTGKLSFLPEWVCTEQPEHRWAPPLLSRVSGAGCPECKVSGKSKVELAYLAVARERFPKVSSGATVRHDEFIRRASWTVDIIVHADTPIAIEYDGAYWHSGKEMLDTEKSRDLLAAGYRVIRLREHPLKSLVIDDPGYSEITVYSTAPDPVGVFSTIA